MNFKATSQHVGAMLDAERFASYDANMSEAITQAEYRSFQQAYDFFNAELFGGALPNVLVTLQRHAKAYGYFSPAKMKEVGLYPSSTGEPGGKETGAKVSHYIVPGGAFDKAFAKLAATGFKLRWQSRAAADDPVRKKKAASKTKYTCPACGQNAWAKPGARLICGDCYDEDEGDVSFMEADAVEEAEAA